MYITPDPVREPLYVVTPIFNPVRYKSRWKLYQRFAKYVADSGAILVTVEASFGARQHAVEEMKSHGKSTSESIYIKVSTGDELWIKENLINIAISRLPANWKYVAWVDADVVFARPNWVGETIHQLQHYSFVQMFSHAMDLNAKFEPSKNHRGFMDCYVDGVEDTRRAPGYYYEPTAPGPSHWHPGYAWAARRDAIDAVGGLIDWGVLGAGDNHMAHALIGEVHRSVHPEMHPEYLSKLIHWQDRAERYIRRNVGVVDGLLLHYWHGKKRDRRYRDRWEILVDNQFQPSIDLKLNSQGVMQICDHGDTRTVALRDAIRTYFRGRNEDSIDE